MYKRHNLCNTAMAGRPERPNIAALEDPPRLPRTRLEPQNEVIEMAVIHEEITNPRKSQYLETHL